MPLIELAYPMVMPLKVLGFRHPKVRQHTGFAVTLWTKGEGESKSQNLKEYRTYATSTKRG